MLKRTLLVVLALLSSQGAQAAEEKLPPVEVFVPGLCLACLDWADYLRQNGFSSVTVKEVDDMAALKRRLKVPADMASVHTAKVGAYFVEGHVPAEDIKALLLEKTEAGFQAGIRELDEAALGIAPWRKHFEVLAGG